MQFVNAQVDATWSVNTLITVGTHVGPLPYMGIEIGHRIICSESWFFSVSDRQQIGDDFDHSFSSHRLSRCVLPSEVARDERRGDRNKSDANYHHTQGTSADLRWERPSFSTSRNKEGWISSLIVLGPEITMLGRNPTQGTNPATLDQPRS